MKQTPMQQSKYCLNCHYPIASNSKYCHQCSQKVTDGRITFGELFREFIGTIFNWDSRFFQTVSALLVPGKLTTEYFKGRHRRFVHPLRIFLVMTLGLVAIFSFSIHDEIQDSFQFGNSIEKRKDKVFRYELLQEMDSIKQVTASEFSNAAVSEGLDTLVNRMFQGKKQLEKDSIELDAIDFSGKEAIKVATDDLLNLTVNEIIEKYKVEGYWERLEVGQEIRLMKDNQSFGLYLLHNVSWMIFFMMPFLALILKLLYIRRGYFYIEHLIFSFHTHSFVFLVYIIMILSSYYEIGESWVDSIGLVAICGYLYFAMKRVYNQNWFKTLVKYFIVSIFYFFILIGSMLATLFVSFALF